MPAATTRSRLVLAAALIALGALVLGGATQIDRMIAMLEWVQGAGPIGWAAFAAVYLVATLLMVPASFLQGAAGFLLGPVWGFAVGSLASLASGAVAFGLARTALRDLVARRAAGDPRFLLLDEAIGEGGAYLVGLLRLSPISPFNTINYLLGLTNLRLHHFLLGTWLGSIPPVLLYTYLGSTVGSLAELLEAGALDQAGPQVVVLGCTLVATVLVARFAQRALGRALAPSG